MICLAGPILTGKVAALLCVGVPLMMGGAALLRWASGAPWSVPLMTTVLAVHTPADENALCTRTHTHTYTLTRTHTHLNTHTHTHQCRV